MQVLYCNFAALAVAGLFYCWRAYSNVNHERERSLRQRVAYLLWVVAGQTE
jgi:hypothetical protein